MPRLIVDVEDPKALAQATLRLIELGCNFTVRFEGVVVAAKQQRNNAKTGKPTRHATPVSETRVGKLILGYLQANNFETSVTASDVGSVLELSGFKPSTASPALSSLFKEGLLKRESNLNGRGFVYALKGE